MKKYSLCYLLLFSSVFAQNRSLDTNLIYDTASRLETACSAGNEESNAKCLNRLEQKLNQLNAGSSLNLSSIIEYICSSYSMPYVNEVEKPLTTLYKAGFLSRQIACLESAFQSIAQQPKFACYASFHLPHCQQEYQKQSTVAFENRYYPMQSYLTCLYKNLNTHSF